MRTVSLLVVAMLTVGCAGGAFDGNSPADQPNAVVLKEFQSRLDAYMVLREEATRSVPPAQPTDDPSLIRAREDALATQIRARRSGAKHGDIFTPEIRAHFRSLLTPALSGERGDAIRDRLEQDAPAPGAVSIEVNAKYPGGVPVPTAPPRVLATLPPLPSSLEYRIIGSDLILLDQPADVILDYIRNVMPPSAAPGSAARD